MRYFILIFISVFLFFGCDSDSTNGNDNDDVNDESVDNISVDDEISDDNFSDEDNSKEDVETSDEEFTIIEGDLECTEDDMFWIYDLSQMPPKDVQICAHVRSETENIRVLVSDEAWLNSVTGEDIQAILEAWEVKTPANEDQGIFKTVTDVFGPVPNEFDDFKGLYLFLYEMESYGGNSFDGYFRVDDQYDGTTSNKREMIHINVASKDPAGNYALSVQAHEFQHLIHWGQDSSEEMWLNEAMSELAMVITGFGTDEDWVRSWLNSPTDPLLAEGPAYNYGVLLLFGTYLYDRFGEKVISSIVADTKKGKESIVATVNEVIKGETDFDNLGANFAISLMAGKTVYIEDEPGFDSDVFPIDIRSEKITEETELKVAGKGGMAFFRIEDSKPGDILTLQLEGTEKVTVRVAQVQDSHIKWVWPFTLEDETQIEINENRSGLLNGAIFNSSDTEANITVTVE